MLVRLAAILALVAVCSATSPHVRTSMLRGDNIIKKTTMTSSSYNGSYYDSVSNSTSNGDDFRQQLADLIYTHNSISYSQVWDAFVKLDTGLAPCTGKIRGYYSSYCWTEDQECGNYKKEGDCFNREHSWPKSWWGGMGKGNGASTDLFLVIPADGYVNNRRGNSPLGLVSDPVYTSSNGAKVGPCNTDTYHDNCFEPADEYKGDMARIYFYVSTAYKEHFNCCDEPGVDEDVIEPWMLQILVNWHAVDPPSADEIAQNEAIYSTFQKNRNPYVDHPEWVSRVFGITPKL